MAKVQLCRNQCGSYIVLQEDQGKWKPFDCDDVGNPIEIHDCPNNPYYQNNPRPQGKQQFKQKKPFTPSLSSTSGGETLDTKRLLQAVMENTKAIQELGRIIDSRTVLDTNKYEQRTNQIYNVIAPILNKDTFKTAAERQDVMDNALIDHSKRAEQNIEARYQAAKAKKEITDADIPDSDEFENMKKIHKDLPDDFDDDDDDDNKGIETED